MAKQNEQFPAARLPQGITVRHMNTGDPRRDFHPKWGAASGMPRRLVDPDCLIVDGKPPYLALPIQGQEAVRVRRVEAKRAALLLTCDFATGAQPVHRLATDDEVAAAEAEWAARAPRDRAAREKDLRIQARQ